MYAPIITIPNTPLPRCPETEMEYFQRVASVRKYELRLRRRERRVARLRSVVHRAA